MLKRKGLQMRLLSFLLTLALLIGMVPYSVWAETSQESSNSTFIPMTTEQFTPYVTGLNVEGVEIVHHSGWYEENSYQNQVIDIYVAETDKNSTATISVDAVEGASVKGALINTPTEIALVNGVGSSEPEQAYWFGQYPMYPHTSDFFGMIKVYFHSVVELDQSEIVLDKEGTAALTASVPEGLFSEVPSFSWTSSDESIATVDANGVVTGQGYGEATITVTVGEFSNTCKATVAPIVYQGTGKPTSNAYVSSISIPEVSTDLVRVDTTDPMNPIVYLNKNITSESDVPKMVVETISGSQEITITEGEVQYIVEGEASQSVTATVTKLSGSEQTATWNVTYISEITEVEVESTEHRISMKLNEWYEANLAELLPEGVTYSVSADGADWKAIEGTVYNYYPAGDGEQTVYFRAFDAEGTPLKDLALIVEVQEVPDEVTVSLSITSGTMHLVECDATSNIMVPMEITVPYFDLGLYGLEDYYYNPMCYSTHKEGDTEYENGQLVGTKEMAEGIVTVMHAYIYATEIYYLGYDEKDAGTGASYESGEFQEILSWTGNVGSSFMSFWDHGTNLNYYVDWTYPLGAPKWGATSDQIALYGGEDITIHLIEDSGVQGSNFSYFTLDGTTNKSSQADVIHATQGDQITLTAVKTQPNWEEYTTSYVPFETGIYWIAEDELCNDLTDWSNSGLGAEEAGLSTDTNGNVTLDTSEMEPGTYYIAAAGVVDKNAGTETGAAVIKLELQKAAVKANVTVTVDDIETKAVNTGILYDNAYVYFADLPYAGDISINDDLVLKRVDISGEYRNFKEVTGRANLADLEMPFAVKVTKYQTTKDAVEEKLGKIPGLDDENKVVHAFHVYDKFDKLDNHTLLYTIITEGEIITGEAISLNRTELSMAGGKTYKLRPTITPANTTYDTITWTSSNEKVAEVANDGTISSYCKGTAVITAKLPDGQEASCTVTVTTNNPKPASIFSGHIVTAGWPAQGHTITGVSVGGGLVDNYVWYGTNCYVTLDPEYTPDDSVITFTIDAKSCTASVNGKTDDHSVPLVDGKAIAAITGTINAGTDREGNHTRMVYISKNGDFGAAPQLIVSATDTVNRVVGESYERNLADVFRNYSKTDVSYTVSIDGAEAIAADENYSFTPEAVGIHKLVFKAKNGIGESALYTVTINVLDEKNTVKVGHEVAGKGALNWIGITDGSGNPIEGMALDFDEETKTVHVTLPTDYPFQGTVKAYFGMTRTANGYPLITDRTATSGTSDMIWTSGIRTVHAGTLANGSLKQTVYFVSSGIGDRQNYTLSYQRQLPETYFEVDIKNIPSNGADLYDYLVNKILVSGDNGGIVTYQWNTNRILNILLDNETTPDDQLLNTKFYGIGSMSGDGNVTLENGMASQTVVNKSNTWGSTTTFTVNLKKGTQPERIEGIEEVASATNPCLEAYEIDLTKVFTDADGDALTYQVKVDDGSWTDVEGSVYNFIPDSAKNYTLIFRAYDGFVYSDDIYKVELTATNATTTFDVTVQNLPSGAEFYCNTGFDAEGIDVLGEKINATANEDGTYTLSVPTNVNRIAIVCGDARVTASVSAEKDTNIICIQKTTVKVNTLAGNPAEGTATVTYGDGYTALGDGNVFYLVSGDVCSMTAVPSEAFSAEWTKGTLENHTITDEKEADVVVNLQVLAPKSITIDADADLKVFYQRGYYVMSEVAPSVVTDNGDGTITYVYSCPKAQAYSMGNMYFATKEGYIDKAGYMMKVTDTTVTWEGDERTGDYRAEYDMSNTHGTRGDDSVLVNVNPRNHLVLNQGDTFRLRSSRIWEIINTDTENVMIEPQFIYSGYDKNIISMVSANETLTTQYCGTGGNNWMDMTAVGSGTTFLEVGYEAVHIVDGYIEGGWGGAAAQPSNFTFNAIDPDRTALIVVQTDGKAATDVSFGIDCLSSNVQQSYEYNESGAVEWDAEFDTVYFADGDHGTITFSPTTENGSISKVEISSDKGVTFKTLTADADGVYTANIYAGNNVIRVTKEDGTTAYQVVRGDKVTYEITMVKDLDEDGEMDPGDTVRVTLDGLHNPIGKMSGIYNPGFSSGIRVTYTWDNATAQQSGYYQYNFVSNAWIEVTVPEDAVGTYSLTDGYIAFNVFGDLPGNHRNLQDYGREINTTAKTFNYTRCLLPEITVYENAVLGDVDMDGDVDTEDAGLIISYYYGNIELSDAQQKVADVDKDGDVDTEDAGLVISYYYGNIESLN